MSTVYRAHDTWLDVYRAIKVLTPDLATKRTIRRRFELEARTMARLRHPHIVTVHDVGFDARALFIVMELIEGGSLMDLLKAHGPVPAHGACVLIRAICEALQTAHDKGIVHRDIKPHNVLLTAEGVPKVADFGIARLTDEAERGDTRSGIVMGTWAYMSPEQRNSARAAEPRSDIYAAGATLYSLITGNEPLDLFAAGADEELYSETYDSVPEPVIQVVERSTKYRPRDRYETAEEMANHLSKVIMALPKLPFDIQAFTRADPQSIAHLSVAQPESPNTATPVQARSRGPSWKRPGTPGPAIGRRGTGTPAPIRRRGAQAPLGRAKDATSPPGRPTTASPTPQRSSMPAPRPKGFQADGDTPPTPEERAFGPGTPEIAAPMMKDDWPTSPDPGPTIDPPAERNETPPPALSKDQSLIVGDNNQPALLYDVDAYEEDAVAYFDDEDADLPALEDTEFAGPDDTFENTDPTPSVSIVPPPGRRSLIAPGHDLSAAELAAVEADGGAATLGYSPELRPPPTDAAVRDRRSRRRVHPMATVSLLFAAAAVVATFMTVATAKSLSDMEAPPLIELPHSTVPLVAPSLALDIGEPEGPDAAELASDDELADDSTADDSTADAVEEAAAPPPAPRPARSKGSVFVNSRPWSHVVVNGEQVDRTPWTGELLAGRHTLTLERDGDRIEHVLDVQGNNDTRFCWDFEAKGPCAQ